MIIHFQKSSIAALNSLSTIACSEFNYFIDAAVSMKDLKALLLDDINLIDDYNFTIPIRGNSINIVASITGEVDIKLEVTLQLQCYD